MYLGMANLPHPIPADFFGVAGVAEVAVFRMCCCISARLVTSIMSQ